MRSNKGLKAKSTLPVYKYEEDIIKILAKDSMLIVVGETGSGKTTQIPQIIYQHLDLKGKMICCTQPRRVAAISVSLRVSLELGCHIGDLVGYSVRFAERCSSRTKVKYVTDGMLVRECLIDPLLSKYSFIILDEVHERSIHTDILLALVKDLIISGKRPDLRMIIMSATLDYKKYSKYLHCNNLLSIVGRTFPIQVFNVKEEQSNYIDAALTCILQIHLYENEVSDFINGDILVFLPGQEDIEDLMELLNSKKSKLPLDKQYEILPLFSAMPNEDQMRVFKPLADRKKRKIIISTNIAETSITIKNIRYVVDSGYCKIRNYLPKLFLDTLTVCKISKNSAIQRAGRSGRESEGKCFRLYTEEEFLKMDDYSQPEILRINLRNVILELKSIGFDNVEEFDFLDPPPKENYQKAYDDLFSYHALTQDLKLTDTGKKMSILPVEPIFSLMLINSLLPEYESVREEILIIVSILQSDAIFYTPSIIKDKLDKIRERFIHPTSDHLTLLNVYLQWKESTRRKSQSNDTGSNNSFPSFAKDYYLNERALKKVDDVKAQLENYLNKLKLKLTPNSEEEKKRKALEKVEEIISKVENRTSSYEQTQQEMSMKEDLIIKCLLTGYYNNIAQYSNDNFFITLKAKNSCKIHPTSVLIKNPKLGKVFQYVVFNEVIVTSKQYLKCCTLVREEFVKKYTQKIFE